MAAATLVAILRDPERLQKALVDLRRFSELTAARSNWKKPGAYDDDRTAQVIAYTQVYVERKPVAEIAQGMALPEPDILRLADLEKSMRESELAARPSAERKRKIESDEEVQARAIELRKRLQLHRQRRAN